MTTTLSIDLRLGLRRRKPGKYTAPLTERSPDALVSWQAIGVAGPLALVLDTTVYIHRAAGRLEPALRQLIDRALLFHCSVSLAELAIGVANADPSRAGWTAVRDHYVRLFGTVPESRLLTPDPQVWAEAGLVAGTLSRTQGFQPHQRKECLNDALILLTAGKAGLAVLTANRREFDLLQQLVPDGRFIHY